MLPSLVLMIVVVQSTSLLSDADFLENCSLDRHQQVNNQLVVDALETFYNDLAFVRAITESKPNRDYDELIEEVKYAIRSNTVREHIERGLTQLSSGNWLGFTRAFSHNWETINRDKQGQSYYFYLTADMNRMRGSTSTYLLKNALRIRQKHTGVSVNELARLDGLITLQIVSQFNHDVDWLYGIRQSPNFHLLSSVHTVLKDESMPLNDMRSAILNRLFRTAPVIGIVGMNSSRVVLDSMQRIDPYLDNFRHQGSSVAKTSVKGILCELAQKLTILEVDPLDDETTDTAASGFGPVIDQARELDADFAGQLQENVVNIIDQDPVGAMQNADEIRTALDGFSKFKSKKSFLKYFEAELSLRSANKCNMDTLSSIEAGLVDLENARRNSRGISLGDIIHLKGKVVFLQLRCFHERLRWAFELDGYETVQQLEAKRAKFGSCQSILPASDLI